MKEINKLVDVKSLVTLALTCVVMYLAIVGDMDIKDIYLMVISFYFGTQTQKNQEMMRDG